MVSPIVKSLKPVHSCSDASRRLAAHDAVFAAIRVQYRRAIKSPPPIRTDKDKKMHGAPPAPSHSLLPSTPVVLPRRLPRPAYREITKDSLDLELKDVNMEYILEGLEALGPRYISFPALDGSIRNLL